MATAAPGASPWLGATEAHVAAEYSFRAGSATSRPSSRISFDDAGNVVLARVDYSRDADRAAKTYYSPALARSIIVEHADRGTCEGECHAGQCCIAHAAIVDSPYWTMSIMDKCWVICLALTPGTHVHRLLADELDTMTEAHAATDGCGTYVATARTPSIYYMGTIPSTFVCTPTTAFMVGTSHIMDVAGLAFDPRNGDLLVLTTRLCPDPTWRLTVMRPGPPK
jgi:hypothetical protein